MKIGVFCSANKDIDPDFLSMTDDLGKWIGEHGHTLVFGGCNLGLMERIAKAVKTAGGLTIGVIPTIVEHRGGVSDYVDVEIPCDNLSDRKDLMLAQSDIMVALPGGVGTLDEIFTVVAARTIGYHKKRMILYNIKDFYAPLIRLLDDFQAQGMIRGAWSNHLEVAESLEELTEKIGLL